MIASAALALTLATTIAGSAPALEVVAHVRAGSTGDPACLHEAVTGFLAGRGIPVRWPADDAAPRADSPPELPRRLTLEIDLTEPARAALSFEDSAGGPKQLREVALERGLDQVGCESLSDVIEASVLALAATPHVVAAPPAAVAAAPLDPPAPVVSIARAPRPDAALDGDRRVLAIAYTLEPVASDVLQSGVELAFGSRPKRYRRRDWMRVSYAFPVTVDAGGASARWQSLSTAWTTSFSNRGPRTWFELAGFMGIGFTFVETRAQGGVASSHTQVGPLFGSDFTVGSRIADHAALYATLRFAFVPTEPVTLEANGVQVFQSWWMFHPSLVVGARWQ
jgi:hypothetical protein